MAVYLRKKSLSGGRKSYYLDIWHGGKRYYEFLKLYLVKARTPFDQKNNERVKELAENIRAKRELELQATDYDIIPKFKRDTDFIAYFNNYYMTYNNKDIRLVKGAYTYFVQYMQELGVKYLPVKNLNEQLCRDYKTYLESKLYGETPFDYFKKFKAVIRSAYKANLITKNYADGITPVKSDGLKKDVLDFVEINKLAEAHCGNYNVKRAFLFCLNTGLRFCDVKELTWSNITGDELKFTQAKTKGKSKTANITNFLNKTALIMIGQPGNPDEKVFNLPSHTSCNKGLKTWVKKAEIDKHITWHCSRHSLAVNLLDKDGGNADVKTVAGVLGHSGLNMINTYLRAIDKKKQEAVNRLPEINVLKDEKI